MTGETAPRHGHRPTELVCYRLDQATVDEIIHSRPEIREAFAGILGRREREINAFMRPFVDETRPRAAGTRHAGKDSQFPRL
jgi:hypothetical protein